MELPCRCDESKLELDGKNNQASYLILLAVERANIRA